MKQLYMGFLISLLCAPMYAADQNPQLNLLYVLISLNKVHKDIDALNKQFSDLGFEVLDIDVEADKTVGSLLKEGHEEIIGLKKRLEQCVIRHDAGEFLAAHYVNVEWHNEMLLGMQEQLNQEKEQREAVEKELNVFKQDTSEKFAQLLTHLHIDPKSLGLSE